MKKNIKLFLLPALLLLAAGFAGCSQTDDTLPAGTEVAQGGEPLNIRIAPKPGYMESTNTRATVNDDTGAFAWEAGDNIIVFVTFNDAAATTVKHWGTYRSGSTASYIADWDVVELRGDLTGSPAISKLAWPLGASSATVIAIHSARLVNYEDTPGYGISGGDDYMRFSKTVALGDDLTIDFAHLTTRLVFTGLSANTAYTLKVNGVVAKYPIYTDSDDLTPCEYYEHSFTTDAGGNLTVHAELNSKLDANGKVKLELVTGGVTVYETTLTAQGAAGAYKMDGYIYKIKVADGGKVNLDSFPDLLFPEPIVAGNTVWEKYGYYVTIPDAVLNKEYQWASTGTATAMENNPCAGHGKWRLPTMKEVEIMLDWTTKNPWSQNPSLETVDGVDDLPFGANPGKAFWSSDECTSPTTSVWCLSYEGSGYGKYKKVEKTATAMVRCVQPK